MDIKNLKYVFHLFLDQTKINEKNNKIKPIYQININSYDKFGKEELYINNDIMKEVEEKINTLTEEFDKVLYYDREQMWKDYSYEQGVKGNK